MTVLSDIEIVTVFHNPQNRDQSEELAAAVTRWEPGIPVHRVDNTRFNRGFAKGCNLGASWCSAPIVGFLNPDTEVRGRFAHPVLEQFQDPQVTIVGERFGKLDQEIRAWGCKDWVCGAAFFVRRDWFFEQGGFDTRYVMYWEETDLIRQAEEQGRKVRSIRLPLRHSSPTDETERDRRFKQYHFDRSAALFAEKWGMPWQITRKVHT